MTQKKEAKFVSVNFAVVVHNFNVAIYYYILAKITLVSLQVRYVFSWGKGGGGGKRAGTSEGRVVSESGHPKWRVLHLCKPFKGNVSHLFQNFFMRIVVMLLSIILTD